MGVIALLLNDLELNVLVIQPKISPDGLADFARRRLLEICELIKIDVVKAKVELGKHLSEIVMRPDLKTNTYDVDGQWDMLGEQVDSLLPEYLDIRGDVKVAPGARTVPNAPRVFFNLRVVM